jgi:hypothetical protein
MDSTLEKHLMNDTTEKNENNSAFDATEEIPEFKYTNTFCQDTYLYTVYFFLISKKILHKVCNFFKTCLFCDPNPKEKLPRRFSGPPTFS